MVATGLSASLASRKRRRSSKDGLCATTADGTLAAAAAAATPSAVPDAVANGHPAKQRRANLPPASLARDLAAGIPTAAGSEAAAWSATSPTSNSTFSHSMSSSFNSSFNSTRSGFTNASEMSRAAYSDCSPIAAELSPSTLQAAQNANRLDMPSSAASGPGDGTDAAIGRDGSSRPANMAAGAVKTDVEPAASLDIDTATARRVRKGTLFACDLCFKKKIRCDGRMPVCSKCERAGLECIFSRQTKKKGPKQGYVSFLEQKILILESLATDVLMAPTHSNGSMSVEAGSLPEAPHQRDALLHLPPSVDTRNTKIGVLGKHSMGMGISMSTSTDSPTAAVASPPVDPSLPHTPVAMVAAPKLDIRLDLLDLFFRYIHCSRPVLSRKDFMADLEAQPPFLLYAMYAYASHIAVALGQPLAPDHGAGYYEAAKKLLDGVIESPSFANLYGISLLSVVAVGTGRPHGVLFLGLAVRMGQRMKLYEESDAYMAVHTPSPRTIELRRRMWWFLYELDRTISFHAQVPFLINEEDVQIGYPLSDQYEDDCIMDAPAAQTTAQTAPSPHTSRTTLGAFPICTETSQDSRASSRASSGQGTTGSATVGDLLSPVSANPATQQRDAAMAQVPFVHHMKLLRIFGRVVRFLQQTGNPQEHSSMEMSLLQLSLCQWFEQLPAWMQLPSKAYGCDPFDQQTPSWTVAHMQGFFCFTRILLHQLALQPSSPSPTGAAGPCGAASSSAGGASLAPLFQPATACPTMQDADAVRVCMESVAMLAEILQSWLAHDPQLVHMNQSLGRGIWTAACVLDAAVTAGVSGQSGAAAISHLGVFTQTLEVLSVRWAPALLDLEHLRGIRLGWAGLPVIASPRAGPLVTHGLE
ncbi:fungal-specific transcription factor domain-containing protein [Entophlyctis helioformis]|nr:fungal-specific transcription factor domain-containing protein [Entophlyctis helioformis]